MKFCAGTEDKMEAASKCFENIKTLVEYLGNKKFLTGDKVCLVDFILFEFCEYTNKLTGGKTGEHYPTLSAFCDRIKNLPGMKEFYAKEQLEPRAYTPPHIKVF